jgi:hypothetical protein
MNFTKQTSYALEQDYDNYWLRRAAEEVIEGWGLGALVGAKERVGRGEVHPREG